MNINFWQNVVSIFANIVQTNIFAKNRKLHKAVNTNRNFNKSNISNMHHRITYYNYVYQFSAKSGKSRVNNFLGKKIVSCMKLQLLTVQC